MAGGSSRKFLAAIIIWLLIAGLGATAYKYIVKPRRRASVIANTSAQPLRNDLQTVKLALDSFSGYGLLRSDEMRNELALQGMQVDLVDDSADYARRIASVRSGETPLAVFTVDALIKACADLDDLPATIVMIIDETRGADAMIAYKSAVPNIDALNRQGARIILTPGSPSETLARVVLANFTLPNVAKTPWTESNGAADVLKQFQKANQKSPEAYVLWEPYVSKALENPNAHVLIDSSRFKGYIVDVLIAQRDFLLNNEAKVEAIVSSYLRAEFTRQQDKGGWTGLVIEDTRRQNEKITDKQAEKVAQGIWWKNTMENYAHLGLLPANEAQGLQTLDTMIRNITDVLIKTGAIKRDPTEGSPNKLYYDKIFKRLQAQNFHPSLIAEGKESVRKESELPSLPSEKWDRLAPIGTLRVDPIVFARGTARLTDQGRTVLNGLGQTLKVWPQYYLVVRGHARTEGDLEANRQLAEQRAHAVAEFLVTAGVATQRIHAVRIEPNEADELAQSVSFLVGQAPY